MLTYSNYLLIAFAPKHGPSLSLRTIVTYYMIDPFDDTCFYIQTKLPGSEANFGSKQLKGILQICNNCKRLWHKSQIVSQLRPQQGFLLFSPSISPVIMVIPGVAFELGCKCKAVAGLLQLCNRIGKVESCNLFTVLVEVVSKWLPGSAPFPSHFGSIP